MACFHPIRAYRAPGGGASFSPKQGYVDLEPLNLGCGQCIGCRLERSRQWAARCVHEAQLHEASCFLTLTYRDDALPPDRSLDRRAVPLFFKRLRREISSPVKYFQCGEYGDELARPHYHALLFGYDFPDKKHFRTSDTGFPQWSSSMLDRLWGHGFCTIGALTFETAAYVARYVCKKVNGPGADQHYKGRIPEFMTCSKGIGERWISQYAGDTIRDDFIVMRGKECPVPRYYRKKLAAAADERSQALMRKSEIERIARSSTREARHQRTPERLAVRETVTAAAVNLKARQ